MQRGWNPWPGERTQWLRYRSWHRGPVIAPTFSDYGDRLREEVSDYGDRLREKEEEEEEENLGLDGWREEEDKGMGFFFQF